jgi:formylglycine-generating enzyme required for sulfatase activity
MMGKFIIIILVTCSIFSNLVFSQNNNPVIGTVNVQQREGTFLVDIYYDVTDIDNDPLIIYVQVSDDSGKTFKVPATTFTGDYGFDIIPGSNKQIVWDAGEDYPEQYGESFRVKLIASDINLGHVASIPQGTFSMGDSSGLSDQQPRHEVTLNEYYISPHAVTNAEYKIFCDMTGHPYPPEGGSSQPPQDYFIGYPDYPVVGVSWYDAVRYCIWLSEQQGYSACYDTTDWSYDPSKNGYHLPTEAQWERAARGGLERMKYPWGDGDPGTRCNYQFYQGILVNEMADFSNGRGTLAVGKFPPNGFGLYDMAGNVLEWCNDWYQEEYYNESPSENPPGPNTGSDKVIRGGAWNRSETYLQCAFRDKKSPNNKRFDIGFRIVR